MYSRKFGVHGLISAAVAFAILGIAALVMDHGYLFSAPDGIVRVEQPTPIQPLEEITVVAKQ